MAMVAKTAKDLARILVDEVPHEESCLRILDRWKEVKNMPGNFRIILDDIRPFVIKFSKRRENTQSDMVVADPDEQE